MKDLLDVIYEQKIKTVNNDRKYKAIGIICVFLLLYIAKCCVFLHFKIFTFLNPLVKSLLHLFSDLIFTVAGLFRDIIN